MSAPVRRHGSAYRAQGMWTETRQGLGRGCPTLVPGSARDGGDSDDGMELEPFSLSLPSSVPLLSWFSFPLSLDGIVTLLSYAQHALGSCFELPLAHITLVHVSHCNQSHCLRMPQRLCACLCHISSSSSKSRSMSSSGKLPAVTLSGLIKPPCLGRQEKYFFPSTLRNLSVRDIKRGERKVCGHLRSVVLANWFIVLNAYPGALCEFCLAHEPDTSTAGVFVCQGYLAP